MKKIKLLIGIIILNTGASCTDVEGSRKALKDAGYHPIHVGGYDMFNGDKSDFYITKFKAYTADSSAIVTGVVCKGIFKGKTIRLD